MNRPVHQGASAPLESKVVADPQGGEPQPVARESGCGAIRLPAVFGSPPAGPIARNVLILERLAGFEGVWLGSLISVRSPSTLPVPLSPLLNLMKTFGTVLHGTFIGAS